MMKDAKSAFARLCRCVNVKYYIGIDGLAAIQKAVEPSPEPIAEPTPEPEPESEPKPKKVVRRLVKNTTGDKSDA